MKHKIFYGMKTQLRNADRYYFDKGDYTYKKLITTCSGNPVIISQRKDSKFPVLKVEEGFSCIVFASFAEAMAFCRDRYDEV